MKKTTGSAGLDRMIANGFRFSDKATLAKKDDVAGISRVKIANTLAVEDVLDPNAKALAVAASDGATLSVSGEVSDTIDGLSASQFYAEAAGSTLSDEQLADAAIGAAQRAAIRKRASDSRAKQDEIRQKIQADTLRRLVVNEASDVATETPATETPEDATV